MPTSLLGEILQVNQHREIVSALWRNDVGPIFPFQHLLCAVLQKLLEAPNIDGDEDLRFGFGRGDVESNTVEIRDSLVNVDRRSSGLESRC